jgi:hypothetical protein
MGKVGNPRQVEFLRSGSVVLVSRVLGVFLILFGIAVTLGRVSFSFHPHRYLWIKVRAFSAAPVNGVIRARAEIAEGSRWIQAIRAPA